ncbi:hypothetical protein [Pedococcus cremeus]|uniref:hypothetical protein n=1 Tax=Pedococcus cremeus TaxID=587636 RepID=UPI001C431FB6|nr:hypothetical protein [Pedococcus cremeus]
MPLRVTPPASPIVATWRAPWWQRIVFPAVAVTMLLGSLWPYAGEPYEPIWWVVPFAALLAIYPLRPRLRLHEDAMHVRGVLLSRVIPIEEVSAVQGGYGGLDIWWGDGRFTEVSSIGEQNNVEWFPGGDGRRYLMRDLILDTRNEYLRAHGLKSRPDPHREQERQRREFRERGWVEHNPPLRPKNDGGKRGI